MNPRLKASGTKRLKLKHDNVASSFAFNLNLRRYSGVETGRDWGAVEPGLDDECSPRHLPQSNPRDILIISTLFTVTRVTPSRECSPCHPLQLYPCVLLTLASHDAGSIIHLALA